LLNPPYADLKSKVGLIYGSIAVLSFFFAFLCVPETKGRSLEDINHMFEKGLSVTEFRTYVIEPPELKIPTENDPTVVDEVVKN
jgi:SP family sugar:H+ symporter-like MFS transporter